MITPTNQRGTGMGRQAMWVPVIRQSGKPLYLEIVDALAADIASGRLSPQDRLPPQRWLAEQLDLNFSTISRAYTEAQRRGLIDSRVGQGSFVRPGLAAAAPQRVSSQPCDLSMNLPPEPNDAALLLRMRQGVQTLGMDGDVRTLLRYQEFGGSADDRTVAAQWLSARLPQAVAERTLVCPGAQNAILAILTSLVRAGDLVCCEELTYPGFRSLAAHLGIELAGLPMDEGGIDPDAFAKICQTRSPKALYLTPTLHNPTTITLDLERRQRIVAIARQYHIPLIEDDAYGALLPNAPPPLAALAAELTYYVGGLSKCLGAGLRIAYLAVPDASSHYRLVNALRATCLMASPLTAALATRWITDGTADRILAFIRQETAFRQHMATQCLPASTITSNPHSFHLWLKLPPQWERMAFLLHLRTHGIGLVPSDAFAVTARALEAVRVCIGGPIGRDELRQTFSVLAETLAQMPNMATSVV